MSAINVCVSVYIGRVYIDRVYIGRVYIDRVYIDRVYIGRVYIGRVVEFGVGVCHHHWHLMNPPPAYS